MYRRSYEAHADASDTADTGTGSGDGWGVGWCGVVGEKHITSPLPACLTHSAVMLARSGRRLHGDGETWLQRRSFSVDRALPLLAMVTVTGGEYIVISA